MCVHNILTSQYFSWVSCDEREITYAFYAYVFPKTNIIRRVSLYPSGAAGKEAKIRRIDQRIAVARSFDCSNDLA